MAKSHTKPAHVRRVLEETEVLQELLLVAQMALVEHARLLQEERRGPNAQALCLEWASRAYDLRTQLEKE